ncbi:hypothetical protein LOTGIDRAFT_187941 [Lottia gigantea]|uniref:NADH dehydrogenase [ubiquinone] 1 beta subcomplex subunit 9 n=1 Tax=Lottia gigantea TaxID=225164 RepID=V3ZZD9_LOTGI|nr:hypothetical protein LOTGIDRAFT_187941 [Lottia gigantea]ESO96898.1 hypothetical protein LOTGIDRAFT_187941 [Lottia gigantea]
MATNYLQTNVLSHAARVRRLYKLALRTLRDNYPTRDELRYQSVLMRDRFDRHKELNDVSKAKKLLALGEEELFRKSHNKPLQYNNCPGGIAYERSPIPPDSIFDYWHPLEKALFPKYFAKREQMKQEYIERWEAKYGRSGAENIKY